MLLFTLNTHVYWKFDEFVIFECKSELKHIKYTHFPENPVA